ncbi:ABC transporter ATP-binding protein [Companilactobacillus sp. RD055328]|uniref:ATP-binding cassette domain-containing protein n=1 Tax=Companilactobacillus sp. RD055328 TaxID=2916634 RepID=UPI001FC81205|nr:ABC transporter ATP-binding protein [Companilactobacillus sp. RD055328]GKQ43187.1 ABC transporter ATP-binding protein [Companilactobacillus sp. RD055328]
MSKIQIIDINKSYGKKHVLKNINLTFEENKIYGLLGRNGAGKSTLMNLISNREFPTNGEITLNGEVVTENEKALSQIYLSSEKSLFNHDAKIKRIFKTAESYYGSFNWKLAIEMIEKFDVDINSKFGKLSTGYSSITKLIIALCIPAKFIFLDEPILGLDANHRDLFYEFLIETYQEQPRTFVVATHIIEEMEKLFEHIIIIKDGMVIDDVDLDELLNSCAIIEGSGSIIDNFTKDLDVYYESKVIGMKRIYAKNFPSISDAPDGINIRRMNLQEYFVGRTN